MSGGIDRNLRRTKDINDVHIADSEYPSAVAESFLKATDELDIDSMFV